MSQPLPATTKLQEAIIEACEIESLIKQSPMREQWEPHIQRICTGIDEAYNKLEKTPEHREYVDRVHKLSLLLQEIKCLLTQ